MGNQVFVPHPKGMLLFEPIWASQNNRSPLPEAGYANQAGLHPTIVAFACLFLASGQFLPPCTERQLFVLSVVESEVGANYQP